MAKESPTTVLRRALRCFKKALTADDIAVILGALLEKQQAADEVIWRHLRAIQLYVGIKEEIHVPGQKYAKGSMVRVGSDIFISRAATSAPLSNAAYWMKFADMPGAPQPSVPERKRKKVTVTEHDAKGRIRSFVEEWESADG